MDKKHIIGIDIGTSATKAIIIDDRKKIIGQAVKKSGTDLTESAQSVCQNVLQSSQLTTKDISGTIATGYGRHNVPFANRTATEITCHARGAYHYFPKAITIIDIGGQDNKVINLDSNGRVLNFKMNRKCAAGTGAFLEEIAYKMDMPLSDLNALAKQSDKDVELGSYCTVFTATEILSKIRNGAKKEGIIRGVFSSIIKRMIEMDPLAGEIVLTGGVVAYNDIIIELLRNSIKKEVLVPPHPQLIGALGAALIGANKD